jgi:DNA-binding transcriptional ArsR family regulator
LRARILASLARRPQTAAQLASALLASVDVVTHALSDLLAQGLAEEVRRDGVLPDIGPDETAGRQTYFQVRA